MEKKQNLEDLRYDSFHVLDEGIILGLLQEQYDIEKEDIHISLSTSDNNEESLINITVTIPKLTDWKQNQLGVN